MKRSDYTDQDGQLQLPPTKTKRPGAGPPKVAAAADFQNHGSLSLEEWAGLEERNALKGWAPPENSQALLALEREGYRDLGDGFHQSPLANKKRQKAEEETCRVVSLGCEAQPLRGLLRDAVAVHEERRARAADPD